MKGPENGRGWAYVGILFGATTSIAGNIGHSFVPPTGAGLDWRPAGGSIAFAVFWPTALFVAIEIFARVAWRRGRRWTLLRWLGLAPVALVAAVVSYLHMSGLLAYYGEDALTILIGPLAVDGLMVMSTAALVSTSRARQANGIAPPAPVPDLAPVNEWVRLDDLPVVRPLDAEDERGRLDAEDEANRASKAARRGGRRTDAEVLAAVVAQIGMGRAPTAEDFQAYGGIGSLERAQRLADKASADYATVTRHNGNVFTAHETQDES
jgi:hypothetical protein